MLLLSWVVVAAAYSQVLPREIHMNKNADLLTTSDNRKSVTKNHLPKAWPASPSFKRTGVSYNLIDLSLHPTCRYLLNTVHDEPTFLEL